MSPHRRTPGEVFTGLRQPVFDLHNACSEWRQGGARIVWFFVWYTWNSFLYCHSGACSEWRQGGARFTGLYDFCVGRTRPVTILLPQCLLQMETGRCPYCLNLELFDLLYCHHDACYTWRQGGARMTVLSDLCTNDINGYGAVGWSHIVRAIRGRLPRNLGRMSWTAPVGFDTSVETPSG